MKNILTLEKQIAIVTGGSSGIGRAISIMLAESGANVAIVARSKEKAHAVIDRIKRENGEAEAFLGDISKEEECQRIVREVYERYGRIDVLVNCAGILSSTKIEDITQKEWDEILAVNLTGTFFMTQQVISYMKKNRYGRVINISSNAGRMGGYENSQCYTASKGGMIAITMGMARQLAPYQITVNVLCPGTTETEMTKLYSEETKERLISRIPMGRLGQPKEIAAAVCFFASKEAGYITGAILDINGGMYMG